jgi:hypothetical protein
MPARIEAGARGQIHADQSALRPHAKLSAAPGAPAGGRITEARIDRNSRADSAEDARTDRSDAFLPACSRMLAQAWAISCPITIATSSSVRFSGQDAVVEGDAAARHAEGVTVGEAQQVDLPVPFGASGFQRVGERDDALGDGAQADQLRVVSVATASFLCASASIWLYCSFDCWSNCAHRRRPRMRDSWARIPSSCAAAAGGARCAQAPAPARLSI